MSLDQWVGIKIIDKPYRLLDDFHFPKLDLYRDPYTVNIWHLYPCIHHILKGQSRRLYNNTRNAGYSKAKYQTIIKEIKPIAKNVHWC